MRKFSALLAISFCVPVMAEEPVQLPDVVVTATRIPTPVTEIPAGVTVIDRQTIEDRGYNTLTDALTSVPGLRLAPSGGPGSLTSGFIRGTDSAHVLVLRDGMPINDASNPKDAFDFGVDTLSDIERIEVVRGPMAALYGSGALGGVINLISRRGTEPGLHILGDLSGGYPAQVRGAVSATGVQGPFDYAVTAASQSQQGFDSVPRRMATYTGLATGFRDRVGTLNLGYTPVEGTRISVFLRGRSALFGTNANQFYDAADTSNTADSLLGRIGVTSKLFDGLLDTSLFLGHLREDRHTVQAPDPNLNSEDARYHTQRTDLQWNNTVHVAPSSSVTFGYQHTVDSLSERYNFGSAFGPFAGSAKVSTIHDAAHAGAQTVLWERLTVTGQMRQEWVADNAPFTWRVGAALDVPAAATVFKAAYGTSFRAPSLFELFGVDQFYVANPGLKPESAQGWEIGFETTLPALGRKDFVIFGTTYFNEQVNNLIAGVFFPVETSVNIGSAHIQGFETSVALHPAKWLTVRVNHTYTDAQNAGAGTTLLRRPRHSGSVDATIVPLPGLKIVPDLAYTGAFRDFLYDNTGNGIGNGTSSHGLIANLTVSYDATEKVQLYTTARNLFGSRFEPVNGFQTPGTSVIAGVRLKLQ